MQAFIAMTEEDRRRFCKEAEVRMGLSAASIEKDFWVCWILHQLFTLPTWGDHLTFKGGTSLSKGWKLIERFSEDIDIVVAREFLGFGGETSPEVAPSKKQRRTRLDALKKECQKRIHEDLKPTLETRIRQFLPNVSGWNLVPASADEDPDRQTLLFHYPGSLTGTVAYLRPVVKIEMGARSDTEPSASPIIRPYLAEAFPEIFKVSEFPVHALLPERTFWEKAMLLHEETYRPADKSRKVRLARHYYDLWCLIEKGVAARATQDLNLFKRIAAHREIYFNWSWMDYGTLRKGALRLLPLESQMQDWRRDYQAMAGEMFFGKVPAFDEIMRVVGKCEKRFNDPSYGPS
jgi:hypothetical protein